MVLKKSEENFEGDEKPEREWYHTSFFISQAFRPVWKALEKLAEKDNNPKFLEYCIKREKEDIAKRSNGKWHGRKGIYIRWILTEHVVRNIGKLGDQEQEQE